MQGTDNNVQTAANEELAEHIIRDYYTNRFYMHEATTIEGGASSPFQTGSFVSKAIPAAKHTLRYTAYSLASENISGLWTKKGKIFAEKYSGGINGGESGSGREEKGDRRRGETSGGEAAGSASLGGIAAEPGAERAGKIRGHGHDALGAVRGHAGVLPEYAVFSKRPATGGGGAADGRSKPAPLPAQRKPPLRFSCRGDPLELITRFELVTSSLPRMRSTD